MYDTKVTIRLIGGASGFMNFASADKDLLASLFKHAFSSSWLEGVQGGNMLHGFMMGAVSGAGSLLKPQNGVFLTKAEKLAVSAVIGGTISEIGGGKFANGAITAAFAELFNDWAHNNHKNHDQVFTGKNARRTAHRYMIWASKAYGIEQAAAYLDGGSVMVFKDYQNEYRSSYFYIGEDQMVDINGTPMRAIDTVHTHPYGSGFSANHLLGVSDADMDFAHYTMRSDHVNILLSSNRTLYNVKTEVMVLGTYNTIRRTISATPMGKY